jgi:hypothetical protein
MTAKTLNRITQQAADQKLVDGLTKHASIIASLYVGGTSLTNAAIVSKLQALIAAVNATNTARASLHALVLAEEQLRTSSAQFVADVRQTILAMFSTQTDVLADFGLAPRKKPVVTPQVKVAAAAKAAATRKARGTKSKKQLAEVSGDVTGIVVTPVAAPAAAPATPTANAPAAAATATVASASVPAAPPKQS